MNCKSGTKIVSDDRLMQAKNNKDKQKTAITMGYKHS